MVKKLKCPTTPLRKAKVCCIAILLYFAAMTAAGVPANARARAPWSKIAEQTAPAACAADYTWRRADPTDHVCVTLTQRDETAAQNAVAGVKNADGMCLAGYVWRQADATDHVCVTPAQRSEAAAENAAASHMLPSVAPVARLEPHSPAGGALGASRSRPQPPNPPSVVGCYKAATPDARLRAYDRPLSNG